MCEDSKYGYCEGIHEKPKPVIQIDSTFKRRGRAAEWATPERMARHKHGPTHVYDAHWWTNPWSNPRTSF